jgi:hypothetical protein
MSRVTSAEVLVLIPDTSIADLTAFITAASLLVDRLEDSPCGEDLTTAELKEVERWLTAHYAAVSDPTLALESEKFEGASSKFSRGNSGSMTGIMSTQFGQMANTLSGSCLINMDLKTTSFNASGGDHYSE